MRHSPGLACGSRLQRNGVEIEFGPYRFAGDGAGFGAPAVGEGLDEEEAASGFGGGGGWPTAWEIVAGCVRHLDAECVVPGLEDEAEVPAGEPTVGGGVRGEFGDEVFGGVEGAVRRAPGAQPFRGEETGEAGTARCGGQQDAEVPGGGVEMDGLFINGRPTSDPKELRILELRYGVIRAQALTPRESLAFIEQVLGET